MKEIKYISSVLLLLTLFVLSACEGDVKNTNTDETDTETRTLTVKLDTGAAGEKETINIVRFIVFKNATTKASLIYNKKTVVEDVDKEASQFTAKLKLVKDDDLMVVAIVNEPTGVTTELDAITTKDALEQLTFKANEVVTSTPYWGTLIGNGMPMTGVGWAGENHGYPLADTEEELTNKSALQISVIRAFAKIELALKKEAGMGTVMVENCNLFGNPALGIKHLYLVVGERANDTEPYKNFGYAPPVFDPVYSGDVRTNFEITETETIIGTYYAGERAYKYNEGIGKYENLLRFVLQGITCDGLSFPGATLPLDKAIKEGESVATPITAVVRNNYYRIVGTVNDRGITVDFILKIVDWNTEYGNIPGIELE